VHVMTLVGADPGVIGNSAVGEIGTELTEVNDVGYSSRIGLDILIGNEGIVFALIELVTAGGIEWSRAERIRLHVSLPAFAVRLDLIDDVGDVNRGWVVAGDSVQGAGGCRNVVWLTGMCNSGVIRRKTVGGSGEVDEWSVGVANQGVEARILHHDDENVLVVLERGAIAGPSADREGRRLNDECRDDSTKEQRSTYVAKILQRGFLIHEHIPVSGLHGRRAFLRNKAESQT